MTTLIVALKYAASPARRHNVRHVVELGSGTVCVLVYAMSALYERLDRGDGWNAWMFLFGGGLVLILLGLYEITGTLRRGVSRNE